jgi:hypothetical protein
MSVSAPIQWPVAGVFGGEAAAANRNLKHRHEVLDRGEPEGGATEGATPTARDAGQAPMPCPLVEDRRKVWATWRS